MKRTNAMRAVFFSAALCLSGTSYGATWTAPASGYWTNSANWAGGVVPGPSADVVFDSGAANAIIDQDVTVNSLSLIGAYSGKITFAQGVAADLEVGGVLYIRTGAAIETPYASTNGHGAGRTITVGGDAVIEGRINADSCGFPSYLDGPTLYHGPGYDGNERWGAGHGGRSGRAFAAPYGSVTQPTALGSGAYGTRGGGAVKLDVGGTLTVNGRISADSVSGFHTGSGGSVWLICNVLAGTGTVSATSANASNGCGGGGGRIAIEAAARTFTGAVRASGATGPTHGPGQPGSLWDPNRFPVEGDIVINKDRYQYHFPPSAAGHVWGLTVTNGAIIHFLGYTNDVLTITNALVDSASIVRFDMNYSGATLREDINKTRVAGGSVLVDERSTLVFAQGAFGPPAVTVAITATSTLYVASTSHVFTTLSIATGSTLIGVYGNTADANASSGGTAQNPHGSGIRIVCEDANIAGMIDVAYKGFLPRYGPGSGHWTGSYWDGGGYGGKGGHWSLPAHPDSGLCYGSLFRPTALGSGASYEGNQRGGGAILLVASNSLAVDGTIRADGAGHDYGGSAGGSVWLVTKTLGGTGVISAVGGVGNTSGAYGGSHGGGGGGRIAVEYVTGGFDGMITVSNGFSLASAALARTGTVFVCQSPVFGASSFGSGGLTLDTALSVSNNNLRIARTIGKWGRTMEWSDTSTALSSGVSVTNVATYTIGGLQPNGRCQISLNGQPIGSGSTNATPAGTLTLSATLSDDPQTLRVFEGSTGTILVLR